MHIQGKTNTNYAVSLLIENTKNYKHFYLFSFPAHHFTQTNSISTVTPGLVPTFTELQI